MDHSSCSYQLGTIDITYSGSWINSIQVNNFCSYTSIFWYGDFVFRLCEVWVTLTLYTDGHRCLARSWRYTIVCGCYLEL